MFCLHTVVCDQHLEVVEINLLVQKAVWLFSAQFRCKHLSGFKDVAHSVQRNVGLMQNIIQLGFLEKFFSEKSCHTVRLLRN
jgi:hypothetical protein